MNSQSMIETSMAEALNRFLDVDIARYKLVATNLANIDTPGYHTRDLDFHSELQRAAEDGLVGRKSLTASRVLESRRTPGPRFEALERPDGNNVSVERESLLLAEAQMKYNLGVQLLKDQFHTISLAINSGGATS